VNAHVRRGTGLALAAWALAVALQASRHGADAAADPPQPPRLLSDTGLYVAGGVAAIDPRSRPFSPQYPLWSDGLTKRRWIRLPEGGTIDGRDEHAWGFPVGTKIWKEFRLGDRAVETRFLWKASPAGWVFASYLWNADGSDAVLAPEEGAFAVAEVAPGRQHSIPSRSDCAACHGAPSAAAPLGFTALQLSTDRDPGAIHGEPLADGMLTTRTLVEERLLTAARADLLARPPRIQASSPQTRSVLGYLAANCGMCHNGNGEISVLAPVLRPADLVTDGDAVARGLLDRRTRWQVPGEPDGATLLVHPGAPERSALFMRMRSRAPSSQMPPLGTVVRDQAAVDAIGRWIQVELVRGH
jgi:hypothetical protein